MEEAQHVQTEDRFAEFAEWIAALTRQLFRAVRAEDSKALDVSMFYLQGFLVKVLGSHLNDDHRWDTSSRWLDILDVTAPEISPPNKLRLRDELEWATLDQSHWYVEPFEFELELYPETGMFDRYTFRFGDYRPVAEKELLSPRARNADVGPGDKGWAFVFHYKRKEKESELETEKGSEKKSGEMEKGTT